MSSKVVYHQMKRLGLCVTCESRRAAPGRVRCEVCAAKIREGSRRYYAMRKMELIERRAFDGSKAKTAIKENTV